jgi:hypothetical protein
VREVRVFGRSGDTPVQVPYLTTAGESVSLEADEWFALQYAERLVALHQARGRHVVASLRGSGRPGEILKGWDMTDPRDLLILSPIAGGTI